MEDGSRISWLIVVFLLFGAMYFAVAETAFASVSKTRLRTYADKGDPRARKALFVTENMDRAITTILIGTNAVHLAAASIVTVNVTRTWGLSAVTLSTIITTLAVFFFGEMLPKSIARKYSERFSLSTAGSLCFFMSLLRPLSALLTMLGNGVAALTKGDPEASVTEGEIYDIIEDMTEEGSLNEEQKDLISSALSFGDVTVESILTSRVDVAAIDVDMSEKEILDIIKEQNHSRIPVYEGTIDNIIGILQIRKYIKYYIRTDEPLDIRGLLDEPYFVHQSTKIDDLLQVMSTRKLNMAVVTDNYGGTLGIVTVEDILEELVGEIYDESDEESHPIVAEDDGTFTVSGDANIFEVMENLGQEFECPEFGSVSVGGYVAYVLERIPHVGDEVRAGDAVITVNNIRTRRVRDVKIRIEPLEKPAEEQSENQD